MSEKIGLGDKLTCGLCRMSFIVEYQNGESLRCPDCKRPFWCVTHGPRSCECGIHPDHRTEWKDGVIRGGYNPDGTPA
jgi:hypothetical protein